MLRPSILMPIALCVVAATANSGEVDAVSNSFKVVIEDDAVLLFESDADAVNFDITHCYNAFADRKSLKKIRKILKKGKNPSLNVSVVEKYFDRSMWSEATSGHYIYKGRQVQDLCQREDLVVINSVKED